MINRLSGIYVIRPESIYSSLNFQNFYETWYLTLWSTHFSSGSMGFLIWYSGIFGGAEKKIIINELKKQYIDYLFNKTSLILCFTEE